MPHLLPEHGEIHSREFPPSVTAATKALHSGLGKPKSFEGWMQNLAKHVRFTQGSATPRRKKKRIRIVTSGTNELPQSSHHFFAFPKGGTKFAV